MTTHHHQNPRAIALLGLFGIGNFGNEASLHAMVRRIRATGAASPLVCICPNPDRAAADHALEAVPLIPASRAGAGRSRWMKAPARLLREVRAWFDSARVLRRCSRLIVPGTGILDDFGLSPAGVPYALLRWCLVAWLMGVPVAFVSVGAGPIRHPVSRWLMRRAAALAAYRSYRDEPSRAFMASIGLDAAHDAVFPDLVFSLPRPEVAPTGKAGPLTVAVGLMSYHGWQRGAGSSRDVHETYLREITAFIRHLVDQGHVIRLVTGDAGDDVTADAVLAALRREGPASGPVERAPIRSLGDVLDQIAPADLVVATRFHNVVCALLCGKPVLSIGYAEKNDALLRQVGLDAFVHFIEDLNLARLAGGFSALCADRAGIEARVNARVADFKAALEVQFSTLFPSDQAPVP